VNTWKYYAEAINAGSFHPALGGDSAADSLAKLATRLNVLGAEGWKVLSVQRLTRSVVSYGSADPTTHHVYYECVFIRSADE